MVITDYRGLFGDTTVDDYGFILVCQNIILGFI